MVSKPVSKPSDDYDNMTECELYSRCRRVRAGFTPSGAPVQTKMWGPLIYEYPVTPPSPDCLHPTRTVVIINILLWTCAVLFPNHYFNISVLLPCCKK